MVNKINKQSRDRIVLLRRRGGSILEIAAMTNVAPSTVRRYVLGVEALPEYQLALKQKRGGSKERAAGRREYVKEEAKNLLKGATEREFLFLLVGLYWGEGTKKDFSVINSDPRLIQTFVHCLGKLRIPKERLSLSIRLHADVSVEASKRFWAEATNLPRSAITRIEIVEGKKKGKLPYGMCRVRVSSGIKERLFIQSIIELVGAECAKQVVSE